MLNANMFIVCNVSLKYNSDGSITRQYTDVLTDLPLYLSFKQTQILESALDQYIEMGYFPCTLCIRAKCIFEDDFIYVQELYSIYETDLKITKMYLDLNATFVDIKSNLIVDIDGMPEDKYTELLSELVNLGLQGFDFSKDGSVSICIIGNIKEVNDTIVYDYDESLIIDTTPSLVSTLYKYTQRSNYDY